MKLLKLLFAGLLTCIAAGAQARMPPCPSPYEHIVFESGSYSTQPGANFDLKHFAAELIPEGKIAPLCYGKLTVVSHGEIIASDQSLTNVFISKLAKKKSKIKDFKIVNAGGTTTLSGSISKIVPIKFSIAGELSSDGKDITLHARTIKADGIPVKGLLELFGKNLSTIMKTQNVKGLKVDENTLSFNLEPLAGLKGHILAASSFDGGLLLRYGPEPRSKDKGRPAAKPEEPTGRAN